MKYFKQQFVFLLFICLLGCSTPAQRFNDDAINFGFASETLYSTQFQHRVYTRNYSNKNKILHVYLDGDGTPWERNRWIADDPTARNSLILRLMAQDTQDLILLGRPCYYGFSHTLGCYNKFWTSHRYSNEVVNSLIVVLNDWVMQWGYKKIVLIGYSGGGTLAVLMAEKVANISMVVTISANLDVTAWSQHHGYSALNDSLNPMDKAKLRASIKQMHFAGKEDLVVPAAIIKNYTDSQFNAKYHVFSGFDHNCCWEQEWIKVLNLIRK